MFIISYKTKKRKGIFKKERKGKVRQSKEIGEGRERVGGGRRGEERKIKEEKEKQKQGLHESLHVSQNDYNESPLWDEVATFLIWYRRILKERKLGLKQIKTKSISLFSLSFFCLFVFSLKGQTQHMKHLGNLQNQRVSEKG